MVYVACDLVAGTARVVDAREVAEVVWCDRAELAACVPTSLFGPVQVHLDAALF